MEDTIASISTSLGIGAISLIRISGSQSLSIINQIFTQDLTHAKSHTIHYGYIKDHDEIIDEVLVSIMFSPKTYTKEDIVEISCHGGITTTNRVLELVIEKGARLALPGEFTKRAFLNGRIDLVEAEGIMNLINAQTETSRALALNQLSGKVSNLIAEERTKLSDIIANIEVNIDYPEYEDINVLTKEELLPQLFSLQNDLQKIINETKTGQLIEEGIKVSIIGRPNVGKSSLLNNLLEEEKAIVTEIKGTTRDLIDGTIKINNILFHFIDTAGIRPTKNVIEQKGITKSLATITNSDLVLLLLNNNEKLTKEDQKLIKLIQKRPHLIIINKIDLPNKLDLTKLPKENILSISMNQKDTIDELKKQLISFFNLENIAQKDINYLTSANSIASLKKASRYLEEAIEGLQNALPLDIVELAIKECWNTLGEIIGETYTEELLDNLFSKFCVGK